MFKNASAVAPETRTGKTNNKRFRSLYDGVPPTKPVDKHGGQEQYATAPRKTLGLLANKQWQVHRQLETPPPKSIP